MSDQGVDIPQQFFSRQDESDDAQFYAVPRLVQHIDDATIAALTDFYRTQLKPDARLLDLMSSWVSHLPEEMSFADVQGLGMNAEELTQNPRLDAWTVQNLNQHPQLPYADASFDHAMIVVSIQYLTRPVDVMREIYRVLRPGGDLCIAMSHRCFPTKAIAAFTQLGIEDRLKLVGYYLEQGGFSDVRLVDRSPANADPLWLMLGDKRH
ncbi:MAG: methyltransferase domain-containing protein [Pseudomonadota bacterium]